MIKDIFFLGDGWGAIAAYKSLKNTFKQVHLISTDESVIKMLNGKLISETELYKLREKVIVVSGYKPLIPKEITDNNICINIHYSLLPKYRGLHSTVWAVLNDEEYVGLTIHLMNEFMDDGPIIHQKAFKNDFIATSSDYIKQNNQYIEQNLGRILLDYFNGKSQLLLNDKNQATWVGRRNHQDCKVDFSKTIYYLKCFFRALVAPYPLPYVVYNGEELTITKVEFHSVNVDTHIGRILNIDDDGLWVKVKDGYMVIKELKNIENQTVPFSNFKIGKYFNQ